MPGRSSPPRGRPPRRRPPRLGPLVRRDLEPLVAATPRPAAGYAYPLLARVWERRGRDYRLAKEKLRGALPPSSLPAALLRALQFRQERAWEGLKGGGEGIQLRLCNLTPFATGLGQPHPVETGFAFLRPYGVPYLAGSGLKGALRAVLRREVWGLSGGETHPADRLLFGNLPGEEPARQGILRCLDLLPERAALRLDVMNPHYRDYYEGKGPPAEWQDPRPVPFLTVAPGGVWTLRLAWRLPEGGEREPRLRADLLEGLARLLAARGLGAKTSWGYGLFALLEARGLAPEETERLRRAAAWAGVEGEEAPPPSEADLEDHPLVQEARRVDASRMPHLYQKLAAEADEAVRRRVVAVIRGAAAKDKSLRRHLRRHGERYPLLGEAKEEKA